jgi:hypothetical protein
MFCETFTPLPAVALTNGVASTLISLFQYEEQSFTLGINPGNRVQCNATGTAGDADLYVRLGENPDIDEAIFECASELIETSIETCNVADSDATVVWILLSAYSSVRTSPGR